MIMMTTMILVKLNIMNMIMMTMTVTTAMTIGYRRIFDGTGVWTTVGRR